ncbi:MAG TPA: phospholipid carrier-dependent glycosyltransferase [Herpetosiphonaceae bacterium]
MQAEPTTSAAPPRPGGSRPPAGGAPISSRQRRLGLGGLALILLGRLLLQIQLYRGGFLSLTADEFLRVELAARWARAPRLIWSGVWVPFHEYMFGALLRLRWDLVYLPRYATMAFGFLSIALIYAIALRLSRSPAAALLSALLAAANPAHVWLSSTPLTEMPYVACVLLAMLGLARYAEERRPGWLWLGAGALACAQGLRFEAWVVAAAFAGLLWLGAARDRSAAPGERGWRRAALATALLAAFPAAWMAGSYLALGDPLASIGMATQYKADWYGPGKDYARYATTLLRLDPLLLPTLLLGGLALLVWKDRRREHAWLAALVFAPIAAFVALHGGQPEPSGNDIRYLAALTLPGYAFAGMALLAAARRLPLPQLRGLLLVAALLAVGRNVRASLDPPPDPSSRGLAVGLALEGALAGGETAVVERVYLEFLAVSVGADSDPALLYDRPVNWDTRVSETIFAPARPADQIRSCLAQREVGLVFARTPAVIAVVEQTVGLAPQETVNGYRMYRIAPAQRAEWRRLPACQLGFYPAI